MRTGQGNVWDGVNLPRHCGGHGGFAVEALFMALIRPMYLSHSWVNLLVIPCQGKNQDWDKSAVCCTLQRDLLELGGIGQSQVLAHTAAATVVPQGGVRATQPFLSTGFRVYCNVNPRSRCAELRPTCCLGKEKTGPALRLGVWSSEGRTRGRRGDPGALHLRTPDRSRALCHLPGTPSAVRQLISISPQTPPGKQAAQRWR